jgi:hypothetical protein
VNKNISEKQRKRGKLRKIQTLELNESKEPLRKSEHVVYEEENMATEIDMKTFRGRDVIIKSKR